MLIPIASFLAGSILSLLVPGLLLLALVIWYHLVFGRMRAADTSELGRSAAEASAVTDAPTTTASGEPPPDQQPPADL